MKNYLRNSGIAYLLRNSRYEPIRMFGLVDILFVFDAGGENYTSDDATGKHNHQ